MIKLVLFELLFVKINKNHNKNIEDCSEAFIRVDYNIFLGLAFISGNPIDGLIINSLKVLYILVGHYFFDPIGVNLFTIFIMI